MQITFIVLFVILSLFIFLIMRARKQFKAIKDVQDHHRISVLTDQNFGTKIKTGTVLVDFWASWCMPCKLMAPVLNELAEDMNGNVTIGKLNVDDAKKTAARFSVRSIPTMIVFRNGKEVKRIVGVKTKDYLVRELDRISLQ
jgi:thioredoxin 1